MRSGLLLTKKLSRYPQAMLMGVAVVVVGVVVLMSAEAASVVGDINNDGTVNIYDLSIMLSKWGSSDTASDLNHDGTVNIFDLSALLSHWGQNGTTPTPTPMPTPSPTPSPTTATCPSPTPVAPVTGYTIVKCDDFNNGLGAFAPYVGGGGSTVVGVGRVASQCTASNGTLIETQDSNGATCGGEMNGYTQKYGYWEVKMRAYSTGTSGSAPHPVLILWPTGVWDSELDYFETDIGNPARGYLHCVGNVYQNCYIIPDDSVDYSQWHVYGFQWTSSRMTGYIDGRQWWTTTMQSVMPSVTMIPTIQLDNLSGSTPVKSGKMEVDWIHMYQ